MLFFYLLAVVLMPIVWGQAVPYDPSPFDIVGTINGMSLDTTGGPLAGGSIMVDGLRITVPKNLLATLPSITVAWGELFKNGQPNLPGSVSWEAHVQGNRVNGQNIAGLVYISQKAAQTLQGFISAIDITTGHFTVGASNIDCVLNDPYGRFGLAQPGNELWSVDPDNPSVRAVNGFPVCIPRSASDPLCPAKNRPTNAAGRPVTSFTFKDPATITATDPDPFQMVPLAVGDYVTISGTEIGGTLWVNNLNVNLGIFTAPGTKPAYVTCEEALFGVVTTEVGAGAGEAGETRAVAFTTDRGGALLDWFAMDVDPCTGVVTERSLNLPIQPNNGVEPFGRAVYRSPAKADLTPATRSVGFRLRTGTTTGAGNITAGQFIQPIFDYTFPELLTAGNPQLVLAFDTIPYLAKGSGPYVPGTFGVAAPDTPVIVGQLSPFPGAIVPATTSCAPLPASTAVTPTTLATSTVPATTAVSTTSSAPATSSSAPPRDTIVITSATGKAQKGTVTLAVTATTSSTDPRVVLSISAAGQNPVPLTAMTLVSPGKWSFQIQVKNKPTSVTVTSNFGGGPITSAVN